MSIEFQLLQGWRNLHEARRVNGLNNVTPKAVVEHVRAVISAAREAEMELLRQEIANLRSFESQK